MDLTDAIPDLSTFSKSTHIRFRGNDVLRHVFDTVVAHCIKIGLAGGQRYPPAKALIGQELKLAGEWLDNAKKTPNTESYKEADRIHRLYT